MLSPSFCLSVEVSVKKGVTLQLENILFFSYIFQLVCCEVMDPIFVLILNNIFPTRWPYFSNVILLVFLIFVNPFTLFIQNLFIAKFEFIRTLPDGRDCGERERYLELLGDRSVRCYFVDLSCARIGFWILYFNKSPVLLFKIDLLFLSLKM